MRRPLIVRDGELIRDTYSLAREDVKRLNEAYISMLSLHAAVMVSDMPPEEIDDKFHGLYSLYLSEDVLSDLRKAVDTAEEAHKLEELYQQTQQER